MIIINSLFWLSLAIIFYTYIGYGLLLWGIIKIKRILKQKKEILIAQENLPEVTLLVAAYNEADFIEDKIKNSLAFNYPKEKMHYLFVSDGSDDETPELIMKYSEIQLFHQPERKGKIVAVNRVMPYVKTPIVVFTDANTFVNKDAILNIVRHYEDKKVGVVSGEKRIEVKEKDAASGAGEGFYWKYESALKKMDSELYSVVGAAGELFSIRTELFEPVPTDTVVEDFYMTLSIAKRGYRIVYEPDAFAVEGPSASVQEELKRKIRIAAGGLQAVSRLTDLLNPFKYGLLSFQYISHRVFRWTLAPISLVALLITNIILATGDHPFYQLFLVIHIIFYLLAFIGFLLEKKKIKLKAFFIPYYFFIMNFAVFMGFIRTDCDTFIILIKPMNTAKFLMKK